jgi:outer membrane receptor protein involved in Fe transport
MPGTLVLGALWCGSAAAATAPVAAASAAQLATVTVDAAATQGWREAPRHALEVDPTPGVASNVADTLAQQLPGVALTHEQGNPWQPTLHYDGFAASPLLGTPQGLSVYFDGVRVNEPFGDVVNWDLLPLGAVDSMQLVPLADPVFGLNTLGGALLLHSADGRDAPGGEIGIEGGSFGRDTEHLRLAGVAGDWAWLLATQNQHEDGFAPFTASADRTLFAKLTRHADGNDLDLSYAFAQSRLAGAQTIPQEWMNTPQAIYTAPDSMANALNFFNVGDALDLAGNWHLALRAYLRNSDQQGFNSNVNNDYDGATPSLDDPVAYNVLDGLRQLDRGLNLALRNDAPWLGLPSSASLGLSVDAQRVGFTQVQQAATFTPQGYSIGVGPFDQAPVDLAVHNSDTGVYFTEKLALLPVLDLTAGGRYEQAHIAMDDLLGGALGGAHDEHRFNPSLDLDLHPTSREAYFVRYAQSMRAPMPVELSCASPDAPCTLPNVLVADPDLRPVIARTAQAGAVWRLGGLRVQAQFTQTSLSNAIQFISEQGMTQGYFTNIPSEQFRSAALDLEGGAGRWLWSASLDRTLATYGSAFQMPSAANPGADANGNIQVHAGDRLPDIPLWSAKLQAQWQATASLQLHGALQAYGGRYAQGDENNSQGQLPGYAVVDLGAQDQLDSHWRLDVEVDNLFNRVYSDFGQLGVNEFTAPGRGFNSDPAAWRNTEFVAPGAPRGVWIGVSYAWS